MTLWETIYDWLSRETARPVIKRDQDGLLPDRPFTTAKAIADLREGQEYIGPLRDDGTLAIQQGSLLTIAIQTFGPGAFELAEAIRNSCLKVTVQDRLRGAGFAYVRTLSGPVDISMVVGTTFEQRASLDIQLRTNVVVLDDVGFIERVELTTIIPPIEEKQIIGVVTP